MKLLKIRSLVLVVFLDFLKILLLNMPCFIKNDCKLENHFEWEAIPLVIGCSTSYRSIGSRLLCLGMNGWEMYSSWYLVSVVGGAVILGLH